MISTNVIKEIRDMRKKLTSSSLKYRDRKDFANDCNLASSILIISRYEADLRQSNKHIFEL